MQNTKKLWIDIWNWSTIYLSLIRSTILLTVLAMTALCFPPVLLLYMILHSLSDGPTGLYSSSSELKLKQTLLDGYTPASVIWQLALNFTFMICFLCFLVANDTRQRPHFSVFVLPRTFCPRSADGGEVELLPFVPRSRTPTFLRGHGGGATQHVAAEEDWPVNPREGKASDRTGRFMWQDWN